MASQSSGWPCTTTNCALKALESHCLRQNCTTCLCSRQLHTHSRGFLLRAIFWSLAPWTRVLIRPRNLASYIIHESWGFSSFPKGTTWWHLWRTIGVSAEKADTLNKHRTKKNILQRHSSFFLSGTNGRWCGQRIRKQHGTGTGNGRFNKRGVQINNM